MNKEYVAKAVEIIGACLGLVIAYQAVRFCQGAIGAPILDQAIEYICRPFAGALDTRFFSLMLHPDTNAQDLVVWLAAWIQEGVYYLLGIHVWLALGLLCQSCARAAARIYMVGFNQYCDEVRMARAEAERERRIYEARERRRELRRKRHEATQPKSGFSVATLVAGIIIGTFFF
ncbi:hypothetical protein BamIOP4010DRAFT_0645 [Burkholderia ambifaria IOP40-10]|uniref:Transmembrane protein n=1 Tax=Burkholderia ambifaria IOP40-10 TaxID=396596 RepID=B1F9D6_9BURK|nr:hypothetical protein [Burkholderia ambifaria]EDT05908.1 hypothetical protein BamIOP4010DRAFT_0645 [Burkholderia ambifaria IOP40-10]